MGLSTYKNAPDGRILKSDTTIAKKLSGRERNKTTGTYCDGIIKREGETTGQWIIIGKR